MIERHRHDPELDPVKEDPARVARCTGDLLGMVTATVSEKAAQAVRHAKEMGSSTTESITDLIRGILREAVDSKANLAPVVKGIAAGILSGTHGPGDIVLGTAFQTASAVIHHTDKLGGDLEAAARGVVRGTIYGARTLGMDVGKTAAAAARGALEPGGISASRRLTKSGRPSPA